SMHLASPSPAHAVVPSKNTSAGTLNSLRSFRICASETFRFPAKNSDTRLRPSEISGKLCPRHPALFEQEIDHCLRRGRCTHRIVIFVVRADKDAEQLQSLVLPRARSWIAVEEPVQLGDGRVILFFGAENVGLRKIDTFGQSSQNVAFKAAQPVNRQSPITATARRRRCQARSGPAMAVIAAPVATRLAARVQGNLRAPAPASSMRSRSTEIA